MLSSLHSDQTSDTYINQRENTSYLLQQGVRREELPSVLRYVDSLDKEIIKICTNRFWLTRSSKDILRLCYYLTRMPIAFKERWILHKPLDKQALKSFVLKYQENMTGEEFMIYGNVVDGLSILMNTVYK